MSDEQLMLMSGVSIYASLERLYCHAVHTLQYLWWDLIYFNIGTFYCLWVDLREIEPQWPDILNHGEA